MILYHGSREIVEHPLYGKGSENNDYGQGFYCTESMELAKEWALRTPPRQITSTGEIEQSFR